MIDRPPKSHNDRMVNVADSRLSDPQPTKIDSVDGSGPLRLTVPAIPFDGSGPFRLTVLGPLTTLQ